MTITIEPASLRDIDDLFRLSCEVHQQPPYDSLIPAVEQQSYQQKFSQGSAFEPRFKSKMVLFINEQDHNAYVARDGETLAGYCTDERRGKDVVIHALFVDSRFRGQGIGKRLIKSSIERVADGGSAYLTVLADNAVARKLYESLGFEATSELKKDFHGAPQIGMAWVRKD